MVADKLRELADAGVTRVRVHYTDLIGTTRAKVIPLEVLEDACDDGLNFCVSVFAIDHTGRDAGRDRDPGRGQLPRHAGRR